MNMDGCVVSMAVQLGRVADVPSLPTQPLGDPADPRPMTASRNEEGSALLGHQEGERVQIELDVVDRR